MEDDEKLVLKYLIAFCKILPIHVQNWKSVLQDSAKFLQSLSNLAEQQRHIKRVKYQLYDDFESAQSTLLYQISIRIEEDLMSVKNIIDKLNKSNNDLKNKLLTFERATLNLDWSKKSELIRGNATQPKLSRLLQDGLAFCDFFLHAGQNITDNFQLLNLDAEKPITQLHTAFKVDLNDKVVLGLLALTQYIDNEKAVV